jgi:hypothetical protein
LDRLEPQGAGVHQCLEFDSSVKSLTAGKPATPPPAPSIPVKTKPATPPSEPKTPEKPVVPSKPALKTIGKPVLTEIKGAFPGGMHSAALSNIEDTGIWVSSGRIAKDFIITNSSSELSFEITDPIGRVVFRFERDSSGRVVEEPCSLSELVLYSNKEGWYRVHTIAGMGNLMYRLFETKSMETKQSTQAGQKPSVKPSQPITPPAKPIVSPPTSPTTAKIYPNKNLVAYWHFDEGRGNIIHDVSGNNNSGIIHGADWVKGVSQSALKFDGVDNYIEIPHSPSLNLTTSITIEVWINQDSPDALDRTIIAKGPSTTDVSNYDLRILRGKIRFLFKDPTISWKVYSTMNPVVSEKSWTHIVVVHVWGKATSTRIYVNGIERPGAWIVGNGNEVVNPNSYPMYISGTEQLKGFNGIIDEVFIWNKALTDDEIKAHYERFALSSKAKPGKEKPRTEKPGSGQVLSIAGIWDTTFGQMIITQSGNKITGTYTHDNGKIEGTLNGNVLIGKWSETPSYNPPNDAGEIKFIFSKDFKSFTGYWKYGFGGKDWSGEWYGSRLK